MGRNTGVRGIAVALLWALATLACAQSERGAVIEVFTDTNQPVAVPPALKGRVTVYLVDGVADMNTALSRGLPADQATATVEAKRRIAAFTPARRKQIRQSALGLGKAAQYDIDRYPAIVFDEGRAVVFGLTDIGVALGIYLK